MFCQMNTLHAYFVSPFRVALSYTYIAEQSVCLSSIFSLRTVESRLTLFVFRTKEVKKMMKGARLGIGELKDTNLSI